MIKHQQFLVVLFSVGIFTTQPAACQDSDFAQLSSKERIRLAEQEEKEAKSDKDFQQVMQAGHELFKERHYLKAIHKYEEAQQKRPYNVYPKVIIADIELSMKDTLEVLRKAEQMEREAKNRVTNNQKEQQIEPEENPTETEEERLKRVNEWERQERAKREAQRKRERENEENELPNGQQGGDVQQFSMEDFRKDLAANYPNGISEEVIQEGNKTIIKRVIVANGKGDEYKRVQHSWGGIFFFKNGDAVTERVWKSETEK